MTIVRWNRNQAANPFANRSASQPGDFLDAWSGLAFPWDRFGSNPTVWEPMIDMYETPEELVVRADLPGMKREDIDLRIENGVLTISGQRQANPDSTPENYHYFERRYGRFSRSFSLPGLVEHNKIEATYTDGILEVRLPKVESARPQRIEIAS